MLREAAHLYRGSYIIFAMVLFANTFALPQGNIHNAPSIYLLQGEVSNYSPEGFAVNLWRLDRNQLVLEKPLVDMREGLYSAQDDESGHEIVASPHGAPNYVLVIDKSEPHDIRKLDLNPDRLASMRMFIVVDDPTMGPILCTPLKTKDKNGINQVDVFREQGSAKNDLILPASSVSYRDMIYQGMPGGAESQPAPAGRALKGVLAFEIGNTYVPVLQLPQSVYSGVEGRQVSVVAASASYFIVVIPRPLTELAADSNPGAIHYWIYNKQKKVWSELDLAGNVSRSRLFGDWLTSIQETWNSGNEQNPGREQEDPITQRAFAYGEGAHAKIPGILHLYNLADGRSLSINTGVEDSEVLSVRGTVIIYRVAQRLLKATISGTMISQGVELANNPAISEVHWLFEN